MAPAEEKRGGNFTIVIECQWKSLTGRGREKQRRDRLVVIC